MVRTDPWDRRPAVFPDIPAAMTPASYRAGTDPAFDAILSYQPRAAVADRVLHEYRTGGVDAAVAIYRQLRADSAARYAFGETALDAVADSLVARDRVADAVRILELNVTEYPYVGWLAFNLGEGYRRLGERSAALEHYRRAFALDKRLGIARDRILELEGSF
jgi:tetratricopeptide (TPR) repeat protein